MDLGSKIKMARTAADITQQELADLLFVSRELEAKWENNTRRPDFGTLLRIEEALALPPGGIMTRDDLIVSELESRIRPHESARAEDLAPQISRFLRSVNETDANIFINRYYLLKTNGEIASLCGMKENQVRSRLSKTVKKLKRYLQEEN